MKALVRLHVSGWQDTTDPRATDILIDIAVDESLPRDVRDDAFENLADPLAIEHLDDSKVDRVLELFLAALVSMRRAKAEETAVERAIDSERVVSAIQKVARPWDRKATMLIRLLEKAPALTRGDLDVGSLVKAITPWGSVDPQFANQRASFLIEAARTRKSDGRMTGLLADLLIASVGGDPTRAGHEINSYQAAHKMPRGSMEGLRVAVGGEAAIGDIRETHESQGNAVRVHLVLLVHGINTRAQWISVIKPTLEAAGFSVAPAGYGLYGVMRFLLPWSKLRLKAVDRVRTAIRTAKTLHEPEKLSVIAHSFGSYIVARLIASEFDTRWHRIIFCGSVNEADFPIEQFLNRFEGPIINEIGTLDFFPALAESVTWGYGSVGSFGFNNPAIEERWHKGVGHSDFLNSAFCEKFWVPFLQNGHIEKGSQPEPLPWPIRLLLRLPLRWILLALIAMAVVLVGILIAPYVQGGYQYVVDNLSVSHCSDPFSISCFRQASANEQKRIITRTMVDLRNEFERSPTAS